MAQSDQGKWRMSLKVISDPLNGRAIAIQFLEQPLYISRVSEIKYIGVQVLLGVFSLFRLLTTTERRIK